MNSAFPSALEQPQQALARHHANVSRMLANGRVRASAADVVDLAIDSDAAAVPDAREIVGLVAECYDLTPAQAAALLVSLDFTTARTGTST